MPELFRKEIDHDSLYAVWEITESIGELLGMIRLRPAERELYDSFVAESRQKQWLAYRILIRSLLLPDDYAVEYDETGKPYLAGSRFFISVTHSGNLAAVILSSHGHVGIDIEAVRPKIVRVREKYMHPEELAAIDDPEPYSILTLAWCAKESLYKLYGHRGIDFKENIRLNLPEFPGNGKFSGEIRHSGNIRTYDLLYEQFQGHMLVYVLDSATSQ
jgi:4'-phosphopantetheinyl transferase